MPEAPIAATSEPVFLTVEETAGILRISTKTVRKLIDDGELPASKAGRRLLVPRTAIDELVARATTEAAERADRTA